MSSPKPREVWSAVAALGLVVAQFASCGSGQADTGRAGTELRVVTKPVEDVFLLTGELRAVRSFSLVTPRGGEREMQIRWMVDDGSEVKEGERLVEFDAARLIQTIEERRLKLRQAENDRESRERSAAAEAERKRVAVDKAEVEAEKARIDAVVPAELRAAVDWRKFQATWQEKKAALDKAKLERDAYVGLVARRHRERSGHRGEGAARRGRGGEGALAACRSWRRRPASSWSATSGSGAPRARASSSRATPSGAGIPSARFPTPPRWRSRRRSPRPTTGGSPPA